MAEKKRKAEYLLVKGLSLLPYSFVVGFARSLAWLVSWLPLSLVSAHRDMVINYLACFPELDYREIRRRARKALVETAHTLTSYSHVWLRDPEQTLARVRTVHNEAAVREALASSRPVLFLSLHQSSWEVPVLVLGRMASSVIMYQPAEDSALDPLVKAGREATGCRLVPTNGKGVRAALAELEQGGSFGLLADHQPGGKQNPCVPFFHHSVPVPAFVHKVVARYQPHVFYLSALRLPGGQIDVCFEQGPADMLQMSEQELLTEMMAGLERIIRRAPEQYNWSYNRYRRGPDGKRRWYKKPQAMAIIRRAAAGEDLNRLFDSVS